MTSRNKSIGSAFEREVAAFFNGRGFKVFRRFGAGQTQDTGDLDGLSDFVIECKNVKTISLSTIMDETNRETKNAILAGRRPVKWGVAVIKRRGRGAHDAYVVMDLEQFVTMLRDRSGI